MRAGFGIGGCQDALARRDPQLVAVLPGEIRFDLKMWLVMHENLRSSRRVRLLYDHLAAALSAYAASGKPPKSAAKGPRKAPQKRGKSARKRG